MDGPRGRSSILHIRQRPVRRRRMRRVENTRPSHGENAERRTRPGPENHYIDATSDDG